MDPIRRAAPAPRSLLVLLAACLVALLTPGAQAGPSLGKAARKALTQAVKTARTEMLADLTAFEATAAAGHALDTIVVQLVDDIEAFSLALDEASLAYRQSVVEAVSDALPGADGIYPVTYYSGAGGVVDGLFAAGQKTVDRALDVVRRRLRKTSTRFAELRDHGLVVLIPRADVRPLAIGPTGGADLREALRITVLLTLSDLAAEDDGVVHLRVARAFAGDVTMAVFGDQLILQTGDVQAPVDGRAAFVLTDVTEGNLLVDVLELESQRSWDAAVGMR